MGTRCLLLSLFTLFLVLLAPVTSFPTRSAEHTSEHIGVSSFLRMLKNQILNRSKGTASRGGVSQGVVDTDDTAKANSLNLAMVPVWPPRPKLEGWELSKVADHSDEEMDVPLTQLADGKRGSDYGHGFFFGKRVPGDGAHADKTAMHRDRRPDDYNWGMWFGKRGPSKAYGWGGFFGKRDGDIIDYEDFVA